MKVGFDFGTTNSAIAVLDRGVVKVLNIDEIAADPRVVRSMLYFNYRKVVIDPKVPLNRLSANIFYKWELSFEGVQQPLIGQRAIEQYISENRNRHPGIKRTILTGNYIRLGTASSDQAKGDLHAEYYEEFDFGTGRLLQALKTALKTPSYLGTTVFGEYYLLEQLIGVFINQVKMKAEDLLNGEVDEVICGRPVKFSDDPKQDKASQDRLEEGLRKAGFKKISFEFEPVAAAKQFIAFSGRKSEKILVFDFGGGTLDTAIVKGDKVLASDGIYIGGDLLNADVMREKLWRYFGSEEVWGDKQLPTPRHIYESLQSWFSIPNLNNPDTMQLFERIKYKNSNPKAIDRLIYLIETNLGFDLYEAIEMAKKELSQAEESEIVFEDGPIQIRERITKEEFEEIIKMRVEAVKQVVLRTLENAKLTPGEIDVVVRTGGSSLIPIFESMLVSIFGKDKIVQFETFTSIAAGLALDKGERNGIE